MQTLKEKGKPADTLGSMLCGENLKKLFVKIIVVFYPSNACIYLLWKGSNLREHDNER